MINYNIVLYIGLFLIIGVFCLFLYSQHRLRQLDIEQWKLTQSVNQAKEKNELALPKSDEPTPIREDEWLK